MGHGGRTIRGGRRGSEGFTLIEVMGGIVIASIALPWILFMTTNLAALRRVGEQRNLAVAACRARIEVLRSLPFAELPAQDDTGFAVDVDQNTRAELRAPPGDPDGLPGEVSLSVQDSAAGKTIYRVRATVRWMSASGPRTFWLETLMTNRWGN